MSDYQDALQRVIECMKNPEAGADFLDERFLYMEFFGINYRKQTFIQLYKDELKLNECYQQSSWGQQHGDLWLVSWHIVRLFEVDGKIDKANYDCFSVFKETPEGWRWLGGQTMKASKTKFKSAKAPKKNSAQAATSIDPTKLYVGRMSFKMTDEILHRTFSAFGKVVSAKCAVDGEGRLRGFGRVQMSTKAEAEAARTKLNGAEIEGRAIMVEVDGPDWLENL